MSIILSPKFIKHVTNIYFCLCSHFNIFHFSLEVVQTAEDKLPLQDRTDKTHKLPDGLSLQFKLLPCIHSDLKSNENHTLPTASNLSDYISCQLFMLHYRVTPLWREGRSKALRPTIVHNNIQSTWLLHLFFVFSKLGYQCWGKFWNLYVTILCYSLKSN